MTPERYEQIGQLYHIALEREPSERAAFLAEACHADEMLRGEVESLLAAHEQASTFIEQPPNDVAAGWQVAANAPAQSQLAHYRLRSLLGKGGMGEVWLADDTQLHRQVAVKLLPAEFTHDAERVRRFAREARAVSALNHPNILTIYEIGATEGQHYIVTEYVAGETLRQRMTAQQPMPLSDALTVAAQIAEALAAAHEAGIIHRDIKPENVMVRRDGYVKVLDFGLAKLMETPRGEGDNTLIAAASTATGVIMGTPRYMSPEQARGEKVDARTDLFSLGVMLYEMVAGHAPFAGATPSEVIAAILRDEALPLTADAPPELRRMLHHSLQKKRDERYQTAHELLTDLRRLQRQLERLDEQQDELLPETEKVAATATVPVATANPTLRRLLFIQNKRAPLLLALLAILIIAASAGWLYVKRQSAVTAKDTILLADFENQTGDAVSDGTLKQGLAMHLQQSPFLSLFPVAQVQQTLQLMDRPSDTRITAEIAREICERQGLKALIVGSIAPLGSHYVITLEVINAQNGETLARQQAQADSREQVLQALAQAATQLHEKLGPSLSSIPKNQPLAQDKTSKLQALKDATKAKEIATQGRYVEAIPFLKRAVELDPQYSYALIVLAIQYGFTSQPESAAKYAEQAYLLQDRVIEEEKQDRTCWYHLYATGNQHKALEALTMQQQAQPEKPHVPLNLAIAYNVIGQSEPAVAGARETLRRLPDFAPAYRELSLALLRLNRFAEAKDTMQQALQRKLMETEYHLRLYQLAFIAGDAVEMQRQVEAMSGNSEEYAALDWQTGAAAFAGQWRAAQDFSRRAIELAAHRDNQELAARYATEQALRGAVLGNCQMSKTSAAQGLTFGRGRLPLARAALALALCGAASQAQTLADELAKRFPEDTVSQEVWLPVIRAALSLQRGGANGATQVLEQLRTTSRYEAAAEFWPQYLRGQAYLKLGQGTAATVEFQNILDHRGYAPLSVLYPLAQLGLARATQNRNPYNDFLASWKEADAELPILRAAKREAELAAHR